MSTDTDTANVEALAAKLKDRYGATVPTSQAAAMLRSLATERDALARRVAELEANGIHSCHPACDRPVCVLVRERDALLAKVAEQDATLKLQKDSYEREIRIEVEAERERCAAICDGIARQYVNDSHGHSAERSANAIRTTPKETP